MEKRKAEKYVINHINTERYKNSAIPSMIKMLNKEEIKMKEVLKNISNVHREHCLSNTIL